MPWKLNLKDLEWIVKIGTKFFLSRLSLLLHGIPLLIWFWHIWKLLKAVRTASSTVKLCLEEDPLFVYRLKPVYEMNCSLKRKGNFNLPDKSRKIALRNLALIAFVLT